MGLFEDDYEARVLTPGDRAAREAHKIKRLRDLLACPGRAHVWSGGPSMNRNVPWPENVAILVGLDPAGWGNAEEDQFSFLPGGLEHYSGGSDYPADGPDLCLLGYEVHRRANALLGLRLPTSSPEVAIKAAVGAGIPLPWLASAKNDSACLMACPVLATLDAPKLGTQASIQSRGGQSNAARLDPRREEKKNFLRDLIRKGEMNRNAMFDALEARFGEGQPLAWLGTISQLRKELKGRK